MTTFNLGLDDLKIVTSAQRGLSLSHARKMGASFDIRKCGPLMVSPKDSDGKYAILDGQHRWAAAKLSGFKGQLTCFVVADAVGDKKQAEAFLAFNNQKAVSNVEKFHVRVTANDPLAVIVDRELRAYGLTMGKHVTCVKDLEKIANRSAEQLGRTLKILTAAWFGRPRFASMVCVRAISRLVNERTFDQQYLIERLKQIEPVALIAKADAGRELLGQSRDIAALNQIVALYNHGKRTERLEEFTRS